MKILKDYGLNTDYRVYIIAEIGINHGGNIEVAKSLIDSAAKTGANAVKFQTYLTEKRAPKNMPEVFKLFKTCEFSFEVFKELKDYANQLGIDFFSTPFDEESVEYLESIDCDMYKVASFDVVNHALLRKVAATGKPIIMSVGMSNLEEIQAAYDILKAQTNKIVILHCVSAYPTPEYDTNLDTIRTLQAKFDCVIGQSDHTPDIKVPLYAVAAGAQVLEKHYRINEQMNCIDAAVSITQLQMQELVNEVRRLEMILGNSLPTLRTIEEGVKPFRRYSN